MPNNYEIPRSLIEVRNTGTASMWDGYKFGNPTAYSIFLDDFHQKTTTRWTPTIVGTGTWIVGQLVNGQLSMTNSGADNDNVNLQWEDTGTNTSNAFIRPTAGKSIYCSMRYSPQTDATQVDHFLGLAGTGTTDAIGTPPIDGVFFRKDDGDTQLDVVTISSGGGTSTETNVATIVPDVFVTLGIRIIGTSLVEFYVDDRMVADFTTNIPTINTCITPTLAIQNGEAAAKRMFVDYFYVAQER